MGIFIDSMTSTFNRSDGYHLSVLSLASETLSTLIDGKQEWRQLFVATTCPDMLAPSLGQQLLDHFNLSDIHAVDLVQGCTGGLNALVLASHACEVSKAPVAVVLADAARQAVAASNELRKQFGNGSFACVLKPTSDQRKLIHHKTKQYKDLSGVVKVRLGHSAHHALTTEPERVVNNPLDELGLTMNKQLAAKLLLKAESFFTDFINECHIHPDVMIFHQVNPGILKLLRKQFADRVELFVDEAEVIGNCGAASFAIAMHRAAKKLEGKKVFLCSFGTGGVINAALYQF